MKRLIGVFVILVSINSQAICASESSGAFVGWNVAKKNTQKELPKSLMGSESAKLRGFLLGYRSKNNNSFIYEIELTTRHGMTKFHNYVKPHNGGDYLYINGKSLEFHFEAGGHIGYPIFVSRQSYVSPIVGIGQNIWLREFSDDITENYKWTNAKIGLEYVYLINKYKEISFKVNAKPMLNGHMSTETNPNGTTKINRHVHYEASTSITTKTRTKSKSFKITPYFQSKYISKNENSGCSYNNIAYMAEPSIKSNIFGNRFEYQF
jgi:hypothetical protein